MYKNNSPIDSEKHPWTLIGGIKEKRESYEAAMARRVKKEAGIKLESVEYVADYCYHASLTDDNVNNIQRAEGQLLDFFTLKELQKLTLAAPTAQFLEKHSDLIYVS